MSFDTPEFEKHQQRLIDEQNRKIADMLRSSVQVSNASICNSEVTIEDVLHSVKMFQEGQRLREIVHGPIPQIIIMTDSMYEVLKDRLPAGEAPQGGVLFRGIPIEHYPTEAECGERAEELANDKIKVMLLSAE